MEFYKFGWILCYSLVVVVEVVEGRTGGKTQPAQGSITSSAASQCILSPLSSSSSSPLIFHSSSIISPPLKSQSISNQSQHFSRQPARFELSLPARVLGWQSFDSIDIHHHFLYCYAGLLGSYNASQSLIQSLCLELGPGPHGSIYKSEMFNILQWPGLHSVSGSYLYSIQGNSNTLSSRTLVQHAGWHNAQLNQNPSLELRTFTHAGETHRFNSG